LSNFNESKLISMKDLIRMCHITEPQLPIMGILRARYPQTE